MKMRKYQRPVFLENVIEQETYERWLHRKAVAHVRRDRSRGNETATNEEYKIEIHRAVTECDGRDFYTNERLDWSLLSKYNNEASKKHGRTYKKKFALLPSVDHIDDGRGTAIYVSLLLADRGNSARPLGRRPGIHSRLRSLL